MDVYAYPRLGRYGRLGNQLWEVAATIALAKRYGGLPRIPPDWEYRPYLSLPDGFYEPPQGPVHDVAKMPRGPYFQTLQDIAEAVPYLDLWYYPSDKARRLLQETHGHLLERMGSQHFTAAHVRRTDYLQHAERFPQLTNAYYLEALARVYDQHPDTRLLVFSDDIPWCREMSGSFGWEDAIFVEGHVRPIEVTDRVGEPLDIIDLFLMTRCRAHVIANSSFSFWGAFLAADTTVFYPDRWFGPSADNYERMWDCIPEGWTQIAC